MSLMSQPTPTLLIVSLRTDQDEHVRYHLDEILTPAGIGYHLLASQEERISLDHIVPFVIVYQEKRFADSVEVVGETAPSALHQASRGFRAPGARQGISKCACHEAQSAVGQD